MKTLRIVSIVGGVLLVLLSAAGFATAQAADVNGAPDTYRIGPEDVLNIIVWKNDAMTRTVPVRPDGKISLPLLNDVQAAGLTVLELRQAITKQLSDFIPSPEVSVIVGDVRSLKVSVIGEVARPARYELRSWTTIVDVLAMAGGFTPFASRTKIVVLRPEGQTMKRLGVDYNAILAGKQENFYLRNGDIVMVP